MRHVKILLMLIGCSLLTPSIVFGESKWSLKDLIPGRRNSATSLPAPASKRDAPKRTAWTAPFRKISDGTKMAFRKTKDAVPAWLMPETQNKVRKSSWGVKDSASRIKEEVKVAHRKMLAPWKALAKEKEPTGPQTVNDFLSLPRPR